MGRNKVTMLLTLIKACDVLGFLKKCLCMFSKLLKRYVNVLYQQEFHKITKTLKYNDRIFLACDIFIYSSIQCQMFAISVTFDLNEIFILCSEPFSTSGCICRIKSNLEANKLHKSYTRKK